ncbi:MAG: hypothetical protein ACO2PL_12055, partial [Armatimonadota bacterium]
MERIKVLIWVDRNQLGRRNLTDSQRTEVIGRIYNTKKMAQGRPRKDEKEVKLTSFSGSDATAKEVAKEVGVSEATVRRAGKFAEAVAALERISPKAAEIVRRDEVRDAKTQLPKVPEEMFSFVAKKHGLSFQIVEREFRDLDEVLIWVDRNQLGRRNLTDWQRAMVMGRLYKIIKRDPVKNLKQFSDRYEFASCDEIRRLNFSRRKGDNITAEIIGKKFGVGK